LITSTEVRLRPKWYFAYKKGEKPM